MDGRGDEASDPSDEVSSRLSEADFALERGAVEEARRLAHGLLDASKALAFSAGAVAHAQLRLACCDLALSQWDRARSAARRAAELFAQAPALADEIVALSLCARACTALGRSVEAVEAATLATALAEELTPGRWTVHAHLALAMAYGWAGGVERSTREFQAARESAARNLGVGEQLEVAVEGLWLNVLRTASERKEGNLEARGAVISEVVELWKQWERQPRGGSLTPGLSSSLPISLAVAGGLMSVWSGNPSQAQAWLDERRPASASPPQSDWLLAAESWLRAELALAEGNVDAAELHARRMAEWAREVEHVPLASRGHRLCSDIHLRLGQVEQAVAELQRQLDLERMLAVRQLDGRAEMVGHQVAARERQDRIRSLAAESDKYRTWAYEDALTGIANLRRFNECLTEWTAACRDAGTRLCVALIDVDRFKTINDTYSHSAGDEVLCAIATELSMQVRETDLPARWGGDEFAILFRDTDESTALSVALRIQAAIGARDWSARYPGLKVGVSVGVVEAMAGDGKRELVKRSDDAMYAQKKARSRGVAADDVPVAVIRRVASWLRRAERVVLFVGTGADNTDPSATENFASWSFAERSAFAHVQGLRADPERFQSYWQEWRRRNRASPPGSAHAALVELSRILREVLFVTERIDGALAMAGAQDVIELYGNAHQDRCSTCGRVAPASLDGMCLACGDPARTLRPNIVLLGETADRGLFARAELAMKRADVVIVSGSDATTFPSAGLLEKARARSAHVVMLGADSRTRRELADVSISAPSEAIVRALIDAVREPSADGVAGELSEAGFDIQCYLGGQGTDGFGLTLQEALSWSSRDIEHHLATLPWMFPLPTTSQVNPDAPVPTHQDFRLLAQDRHVIDGMRRAFALMLRHYGLQWQDGRVERAAQWMHGFALWAVSGSYHDLFISRILGALTLCGLREEATAFLHAVEAEVLRYRGDQARTPLQHWRLAVSF